MTNVKSKSKELAVITNEYVKTEITLVAAGTLKSRLGKMSKDSIASTLSLAYYTTMNGNVSPLGNCLQNITTLLNPVYRQFISAKFNKEAQKWEFNVSRSKALCKSLNLNYQDCSFEDFVVAVEKSIDTKAAKVADKKAQDEALSPQEKADKTSETIVSYLTKHCADFSDVQLQDMILQARKKHEASVK